MSKQMKFDSLDLDHKHMKKYVKSFLEKFDEASRLLQSNVAPNLLGEASRTTYKLTEFVDNYKSYTKINKDIDELQAALKGIVNYEL